MHDQLITSGLARKFKMSSETDKPELAKYLNRVVRYKRELLTHEFVKKVGTIVIDNHFVIREVQIDRKGRDCLRGYAIEAGDTFGRVIYPEEIEILTLNIDRST